MNNLRIALVGLGAHALKTVIPAINKCDGIELVALVTSKLLEQLDSSLTHLAIYKDVESLAAEQFVDAAYVASPVEAHFQQCKRLIESGTSVLCEKKLCSTYSQTKELFILADENKVVLQEALAYLYHPQFFTMKKYLDSQKLGSLQFVNAKFTVPSFDNKNIRYSASLGGGALNDVAIYPLSLLLALFKENLAEKSSVVVKSDAKGVDIKGQLSCNIGGVVINAQWAFDTSYSNKVEFIYDDHQLCVDRAFSKPANFKSQLVKQDTFGGVEYIHYPAADQFELMLREFIKSIDSKVTPHYQSISLSVAQLIEEIKINVARN
jgi:predicted dehydrogenase